MKSYEANVNRAVISLLIFSTACLGVYLLPGVSNGSAEFLLFLLGSTSFAVGFLLCFKSSISGYARLAMGYLGLVAFFQLWAAALTLKNDFAAVLFLFEPVGPIAELVRATCFHSLEWLASGAGVACNDYDDRWQLAAVITMVISALALASVIGMAGKIRFAYLFWALIIAISCAASLRILFITAVVPVNAQTYYGNGDPYSPWWTLLWPASCTIACCVAWNGSRS